MTLLNSYHFRQDLSPTSISLYLNIANVTYPQLQDSIRVEFQRRGNEEVYTMVDGPKLADGSPVPAVTIFTLAGEGQTLVDLIKQA